MKLNNMNEYVCNTTGIRYRKTVDWDKTFIIKADEKLLEGYSIVWMHLGGCIKMNDKFHQVKNKTFETLEDLKTFVKGLNRAIICQIPYEAMKYYDIDKSEPLIKKVSRENCEEVRYLLEYYDVNGD